ncbi:hypothetical protein TGCAST_362980 [Toxoplasma gondii CAST]|uniref:Uncharacterized protein n=1 Tax=Toxoplasma gondii CAST TaxID=943122 RepID=A0A425HR67_TOXGO|nr:hypothetical protein TGCAST_362980 [Toxoplasma gondii CAST]
MTRPCLQRQKVKWARSKTSRTMYSRGIFGSCREKMFFTVTKCRMCNGCLSFVTQQKLMIPSSSSRAPPASRCRNPKPVSDGKIDWTKGRKKKRGTSRSRNRQQRIRRKAEGNDEAAARKAKKAKEKTEKKEEKKARTRKERNEREKRQEKRQANGRNRRKRNGQRGREKTDKKKQGVKADKRNLEGKRPRVRASPPIQSSTYKYTLNQACTETWIEHGNAQIHLRRNANPHRHTRVACGATMERGVVGMQDFLKLESLSVRAYFEATGTNSDGPVEKLLCMRTGEADGGCEGENEASQLRPHDGVGEFLQQRGQRRMQCVKNERLPEERREPQTCTNPDKTGHADTPRQTARANGATSTVNIR